MEKGSEKFSINWTDVWKTLRGVLINIGGFTMVVAGQALAGYDFGVFTIMVGALASGLIELGRRYMGNYSLTKNQ